MAGPPSPAAAQPTPGFPNTPGGFTFNGFTGLNTKPGRSQIGDNEFFWCENVQPTGPSTCRTVYGVGTPIYTAPGGLSIATFEFVGIWNVAMSTSQDYCIVVLSDGSVVAYAMGLGTSSQIAAPGTLSPAYQNYVQVKGFGGSFVVMVNQINSNGYFMWDGTNFYQYGTLSPQIVIDNAGNGYTAPVTIGAFGGSGTGVSVTATNEVNSTLGSFSIASPGSGYAYDDYPILTFTGGIGATTYQTATAVPLFGGTPTIQSVSIVNPGNGYTSTASVSVHGGAGSGATLTATVSGGSITSITVVNGGQNYYGAGAVPGFTPTIDIQDANNPIAHGHIPIMPYGITGSCLENYVNRTWLANGPTVEFSAAGAPSDFSVLDGAGAFQSTDPFLRTQFNALKQANGYLYLFGDSSVNYISGVAATTTSAPTFFNLNVNPSIGLPWPQALVFFNNQIVFANGNGLYALNGGTIQKISPQLDRIWPSQATVGGFLPSMAGMTVNGVECFGLLIPVVDPISGYTVTKLLCSDGQKWWAATQEPNLLMVATYESNSFRTAYGTDGNSIYPLFQAPSTSLTKVLQSKLFDPPGYWYTKLMRRLYGQINYFSLAGGPTTVKLDNESGSSPTTFSVPVPSVTGVSVFGPYSVSEPGVLGGLTVTTNLADAEFYGFAVIGQLYSANT